MTNTPLVSIMIPVFNQEKYILETINSVLRQTYPRFELIVHDDASTDNTWELLNNIKDDRLLVIHTDKNHGMIGGWNYLFKLAKGKYFKQMGSDDLLAPTCLAKQVSVLETHPGVALVTSRRRVIDEQGRLVRHFAFDHRSKVVPGRDYATQLLQTLQENKIGEPVAVMFPKKLVRQAGKFDPLFSQFADFEYWIRLLQFGQLAYIHEPLCSFRTHSSNNTSQAIRDGRFITETYALINKYYNSAHYRKVFALTKKDRIEVTKQKTLDIMKNIKDLLTSGQLSQAWSYYRLLARQVPPSSLSALLLRRLFLR